jgi:signal transduction histidine kinase
VGTGRLILALLIPLAAFALEWVSWNLIRPHVWFMFFPAVFFSSWLGGKWIGFGATAFSTVSVWLFFTPLNHSLALLRPTTFIVFGVFTGMGVLISLTLDRLRQARARVAEALMTASAAKEQLEARTAQLEAANLGLEAFSYSVSHDLKAPLRGIDGYSQLLEQDCADRLDDEGRMFIGKIRAAVAQMHELIEDLLSYSRMERRTLQSVTLDLAALARAVAAERTDEMTQAGVQLELDIPSLMVRADREGLTIVLRNLLENAIKFSRNARPPMVAIGARAEAGKVVVWVRDNGIGFDMKFHERIFEIFQRLQRPEDYPGTGIGLALVHKAMHRMGGRAWAESLPGQGATFFLELPA